MAKFDYARKAKLAKRLLDKFGASVPFTYVTGSTYDPFTGDNTVTTATVNKSAVILPSNGDQFVNGTLVQSGQRVAYVEPSASFLSVGTSFTADGQDWIIKGVEKLAPAGVAVLYTLLVESNGSVS